MLNRIESGVPTKTVETILLTPLPLRPGQRFPLQLVTVAQGFGQHEQLRTPSVAPFPSEPPPQLTLALQEWSLDDNGDLAALDIATRDMPDHDRSPYSHAVSNSATDCPNSAAVHHTPL